jgi:hypothetical protein
MRGILNLLQRQNSLQTMLCTKDGVVVHNGFECHYKV